MITLLVYVTAVVALTAATEQPVRRFDGDHLLQISVQQTREAELFRELERSSVFDLDYWTGVPDNGKFDVRVPAAAVLYCLQLLEENTIGYTVITDNIQTYIDKSNEGQKASEASRAAGDIIGTFARVEEIHDWMTEMCSEYSDIAECEDIGTSYEGRPLRLIKITNGEGTANKPILWIDSMIHAREWIAEGTVMWIADHILKNAKTDSKVMAALAQFDVHILPIVNPDGYEYTHKVDRFWRKTRSRHGANVCFGVDGNRNYDFMWGQAGASASPCQDTYMGPKAFSEPETEAMYKHVGEHSDRIKIFFSLHSYSQIWLTQWGDGTKPEDNADVVRVGRFGVIAISSTNGRNFVTGTPPELLGYRATGTSNDWAKGAMGIKYAYVLELRPRDGPGTLGFIVDASEIVPSGQEIWAGIYAAAMAT